MLLFHWCFGCLQLQDLTFSKTAATAVPVVVDITCVCGSGDRGIQSASTCSHTSFVMCLVVFLTPGMPVE